MRDSRVMTKKQLDLREHSGQHVQGKSSQENRGLGKLTQQSFHHCMIRRALEEQRLQAMWLESFDY